MATKRQKVAVAIICKVLRDRKVPTGFTAGKALKQVGYSDSVCKKPSLVTGSKGFIKLVSEELPDFFH